jgi:hypothetical protein
MDTELGYCIPIDGTERMGYRTPKISYTTSDVFAAAAYAAAREDLFETLIQIIFEEYENRG